MLHIFYMLHIYYFIKKQLYIFFNKIIYSCFFDYNNIQEKEEMYKDTKELEISCQFCGTTYKV